MAKLSAHGRTAVYTSDSFNFRERIMSDGAVLRNYGAGWKVHGKIKKELTPEQAGRMIADSLRRLDDTRPALAAYLAKLLDLTNLETRGMVHTCVQTLPDDPDAVYVEVNDHTRAEIDMDDAETLCRLYRSMIAERQAAKTAATA